MRPSLAIQGLCVLILGAASPTSAQTVRYYHTKYSDSVAVTFADSLVLIKHDSAFPDIGGATFANLAPEVRDVLGRSSIPTGYFLYLLEPGYSLFTALDSLRVMAEVDFANPVWQPRPDELVFLTNEFIVKFLPSLPRAVVDSLNAQHNTSILLADEYFPDQYLIRLTANGAEDLLSVVQGYHVSGFCIWVEPNFVSSERLYGVPNDSYFPEQWYLRNDGQTGGAVDADIDADSAWEITQGDLNIVIGVIDGGFQLSHEELVNAVLTAPRDVAGVNYMDREPDGEPNLICNSWFTHCWHGTAVAGLLVGAINNQLGHAGQAAPCKWMPIKAWDDNNMTDTWTLASAINWARVHGAHVISCSWGVSGFSSAIDDALEAAHNAGISIFFASGNEGSIGGVEYPASSQWVVAVGATTDQDVLWRSGDKGSGYGDSLDIVAPGAQMVALDLMGTSGRNPEFGACNGDADYLCDITGTSYACPLAAGTAALVISRRPDLMTYFSPADTVRKVICLAAQDTIGDVYDTPGWDQYYGYGRVNAYRALLSVIRGDCNNDGIINPADVVCLVNYVHKGQTSAIKLHKCIGDCNCDGYVNPVDVVVLVSHVYSGAPRPQICFNYME